MKSARTCDVGDTRSGRALVGLIAVLMLAAGCASADGADQEGDGDASPAQAEGTEASPSGSGEASGDPYRIGVLNPLSGNVAFLGTAQLDMFNAYFDKMNDEGGIDGHPVELVVEDNQGTVERTLSAFRSLEDQGVSAILGPSISSNVEAVAPLAEEAGISLIAIGAFPEILDPPPTYLFQVDSTSASNARMSSEFAADLLPDLDEIKAALVPIDTPSSFAWRDDVSERWGPENGVTVTSSTTIPLTAQDLTAESQSILEGNPDIVLTQALDASLPLLVEKLRALGFEGPVVGYHAGNADATLLRMGDDQVFVPKEMRGMNDDPEGRPGLQFLHEAVEAAGLVEAMEGITQSSLGWMGAEIVAGVLEECGFPCDATAFNDTLQGITIDTEGVTFEPIDFSPDEHQGVEAVTMYHWTGAEIAPYDDTVYSTSVYD